MSTTHTTIPSPVGPLALEATDDALTAVRFASQRRAAVVAAIGAAPRSGVLAETARQLAAYFAGELRAFELPLEPAGTPFQRIVWNALLDIPYGDTTSYGELARRIGHAGAARAVGLANGSNPIAIVIPCHRVIGSDGRLTGYGGGLDRKQKLLTLEQGAFALT